jgi:hypothetical protein
MLSYVKHQATGSFSISTYPDDEMESKKISIIRPVDANDKNEYMKTLISEGLSAHADA